MGKRLIFLFGSLLLLFLLASCGKDKAQEEVIKEKEKETAEEPKSPAKEEPNEQAAPTISETKVIIDDLVKKIQTVYIDAGSKYHLVDQPLTDAIYQSMAKDLQPFATEQLIKTDLFEIAQDFCYAGCDASYFPHFTEYSLRFKMLESTSERVIMEYVFPENELSGPSTQQVTIKKADGTWKLDDYTFSNIPLNLNKEEAIEVMAINGFSGFQFVKEAQLEDPEKGLRKIFIFKTNGEINEQVAIYADTGYSYILPEDTPLK